MGIASPPQRARPAHGQRAVYWGLFALVEPVSKPVPQRAACGEESGNLFDYEWREVLTTFRWRGENPEEYVPLPFQPETNEDHADVADGVVAFVQAINETPLAGYAAAIGSRIDVDRFLAHVAVENAIAEGDGVVGDQGLNNFYLYEYGQKNRFVFIPWDKDNTFRSGSWPLYRNLDKNVLTARLSADPAKRQVCANAGIAAATNFVNPRWLTPQLETAYQQIRAGALADARKPFSNGEFEAAVDGLRGVIAARSTTSTPSARAVSAWRRLLPRRWPTALVLVALAGCGGAGTPGGPTTPPTRQGLMSRGLPAARRRRSRGGLVHGHAGRRARALLTEAGATGEAVASSAGTRREATLRGLAPGVRYSYCVSPRGAARHEERGVVPPSACPRRVSCASSRSGACGSRQRRPARGRPGAAGHEHLYERTHPIGGVVYLTTGAGGAGLTRTATNPFTAAFANDRHGYTYVEVSGRTLRLRQMDTAGARYDALELTKPVAAADPLLSFAGKGRRPASGASPATTTRPGARRLAPPARCRCVAVSTWRGRRS